MRPTKPRDAWYASAALLFVVAACLPQTTNSVFGLSGSIAQLFGAAAGRQSDAGEVTLEEMRRLRMQNLASVAAVLLHGERSKGGACGDGRGIAVLLAEHASEDRSAGTIVADPANEADLPRHSPADGALWDSGNGARPGKRATGGQESAERQRSALEGMASQAKGRDERMAALLEEVQRLRAENEVLRAHHDQDKSADGMSKLVCCFVSLRFVSIRLNLTMAGDACHGAREPSQTVGGSVARGAEGQPPQGTLRPYGVERNNKLAPRHGGRRGSRRGEGERGRIW